MIILKNLKETNCISVNFFFYSSCLKRVKKENFTKKKKFQ